jgi:hypothetical protein
MSISALCMTMLCVAGSAANLLDFGGACCNLDFIKSQSELMVSMNTDSCSERADTLVRSAIVSTVGLGLGLGLVDNKKCIDRYICFVL